MIKIRLLFWSLIADLIYKVRLPLAFALDRAWRKRDAAMVDFDAWRQRNAR